MTENASPRRRSRSEQTFHPLPKNTTMEDKSKATKMQFKRIRKPSFKKTKQITKINNQVVVQF